MQATGEDYDIFKLILIGNSAVGKSSLLYRFADNNFSDDFTRTIGVDFKIKKIEIQQKTIKLQLWDTAGEERFKAITSAYYRGASGIILVYDITDRQSFKDIKNLLTEVETYSKENTVKLLVGNKCDLEGKRQVSKEEGQEMAKALDIKFIETSAKDAVNVEKAFVEMAQEIKGKISKEDNITGNKDDFN